MSPSSEMSSGPSDFERIREQCGSNLIVGESPALRELVCSLPRIAGFDVPVLVQGETGTGKELIARAIHYLSHRRSGPFVTLPCGCNPGELFENELFGHEAGAFTGASSNQKGILESAEHGTLLLDDVDALSPQSQPKILRLLQEGEYRILGNSRVRRADVRIISTCNKDLRSVSHGHQFREDLYYRLAAVTIAIPPLHERPLDIPCLADHLLTRYSHHYRKPCLRFSDDAMQALSAYSWPGNVRELEHSISRAVMLADGVQIEVVHLGLATQKPQPVAPKFAEARREAITQFEREYIRRMIALHEGNVTKAALAAGLDRRSFYRLMKKHGIRRDIPLT
jgi:two-component system, NtrC family, response regulator GlrR